MVSIKLTQSVIVNFCDQIYTAKFNGTVPGTIDSEPAESTTAVTMFATDNHFANGNPLFYGIVGITGFVVTVILFLMMVCLSLQCKEQCHRKFINFAAPSL